LSYSLMRPVFHIGVCLVEKLCNVPFIVDLLWSEVWDIMSARYYWRIVIFICMVLHCRFLCFLLENMKYYSRVIIFYTMAILLNYFDQTYLLRGLCFMRVLRCIGCLLSVNSFSTRHTPIWKTGRISEYDKVLYNNSAVSFSKGGTIAGLQVLTILKKF
jgi:hypothetical protein